MATGSVVVIPNKARLYMEIIQRQPAAKYKSEFLNPFVLKDHGSIRVSKPGFRQSVIVT